MLDMARVGTALWVVTLVRSSFTSIFVLISCYLHKCCLVRRWAMKLVPFLFTTEGEIPSVILNILITVEIYRSEIKKKLWSTKKSEIIGTEGRLCLKQPIVSIKPMALEATVLEQSQDLYPRMVHLLLFCELPLAYLVASKVSWIALSDHFYACQNSVSHWILWESMKF